MTVLEENPGARIGIGVLVSLCASTIDAIGLNLMRRDHLQNARLPPEEQRADCRRVWWHIGFYMYIGSQVLGSSGALVFLQPAVVAALGSAALVFNFIFAYWLVGTRILKMDLLATGFIIVGAVLVAWFGSVNKGDVSVTKLLEMYQRPQFIIYFSILVTVALTLFVTALLLTRKLNRMTAKRRRREQEEAEEEQKDAEGKGNMKEKKNEPESEDKQEQKQKHEQKEQKEQKEQTGESPKHTHAFIKALESLSEKRLRKYTGVMYAVAGGTIASMTVIVAETAILLITSKENQFTSPTPFIILLLLLLSGVLQVISMNAGLRTCDTVLIVPLFFSFYSLLAFLNANVYHDQWGVYGAGAYVGICVGLVLLVPGVYLISAGQAKRPGDPVEEEEENLEGVEDESEGGEDEGDDMRMEEVQVEGRHGRGETTSSTTALTMHHPATPDLSTSTSSLNLNLDHLNHDPSPPPQNQNHHHPRSHSIESSGSEYDPDIPPVVITMGGESTERMHHRHPHPASRKDTQDD